MSDIESAFATALEDVEQLPDRPGNQDLLRLYALYKQPWAMWAVTVPG